MQSPPAAGSGKGSVTRAPDPLPHWSGAIMELPHRVVSRRTGHIRETDRARPGAGASLPQSALSL